MLIQRRLKCSDQWLVKHVGENPYLQYFIGMKGNDPPNSGTLVLDAACRESEGLRRAVARYRERYGCYPQRILADKLYRSRQTLAFAKSMAFVCPARPLLLRPAGGEKRLAGPSQ